MISNWERSPEPAPEPEEPAEVTPEPEPEVATREPEPEEPIEVLPEPESETVPEEQARSATDPDDKGSPETIIKVDEPAKIIVPDLMDESSVKEPEPE